ncbi:peptidoglycan recognition protein 4-like isoform X1 [Macrosteles quadrilineatus]|uniref:peptidoglycan recognition protein 4-like isoform X1 n=1 Tax=Macrosteles quadrilineatus TaxID=74068 RepID=UPI0023E12E04|nr:peptidoglycan recognition protein 4-like isoform X1 [Macrosteles quadrilineatus]
MSSPRPSLVSTSSVVSTSSDCSDEEAKVAPLRRSSPKSQTTVNVGQILVDKNADAPGVLNGTLRKTTLNFFINHGLDGDADVNDLVTDAVKIKSETVKTFIPDYNSSYKLNGTKEDVEGLSRRWCYLISALVTLSLITLLGTAVLSLTNWKTSQSGTLSPDIQKSIDGLSAEEKYFASYPGGPPIVTRSMWLAAPPRAPLDKNSLPATTVVVCHTATANCTSQPECIEIVRAVQQFQQVSRGWSEISYSFLIGGDGSVYWGRGFNFEGAHTKGFNKGSIGIAFLGTYINVVPNDLQIDSFTKLLKIGVESGKISSAYSLVAQCQLKVTAAPGLSLVNVMMSWPHFNTSLPVKCTEG